MPLRASAPIFVPSDQRTLTDIAGFGLQRHKGEGCCNSTFATGAPAWIDHALPLPANRGHPPPMDCGLNREMRPRLATHKRSFRRACRRAIRFGYARYHGQVMTTKQFPAALVDKIQKMEASGRPRDVLPLPGQSSASRLSVMLWNPGGMAPSTLLELRLWLRHHPKHIVILPETRWGFDRIWHDDCWTYVHSSSKEPRSGGILVMISRRLIQPEQVGFEVIQAGRLLHVRMHMGSTNLDIIAAYQFVDNGTQETACKREQFWQLLDQTLSSIPNRNGLICSGDFNCSVHSQHPWIGTSSFQWQGRRGVGPRHPDMPSFAQIIRSHGLLGLNTWNSHAGPTFFHTNKGSRIDFAFTRLVASDGQSRMVEQLPHADFLPTNSTHHVPMVFTIRKNQIKYHQHRSTTACMYTQRTACRTAAQQDSAEWLQLSGQVAQACMTSLHQPPTDDSIFQLHASLTPIVSTLFPNKPTRFPQPDHTLVDTTIKGKWAHRRALRALRCRPQTPPLQHFWQAWFHWSRSRILQRQQQRLARQAQARRFQDLCVAVQEAAHKHDAYTMFNIINKFTPKAPLSRVRLKTAEGKIADQYMAHALTVQYVTEAWQGPATIPVSGDPPGIPFDIHTLERAILELHSNKSVAAPFLPAIVWQGAPRELAMLLMNHLSHWWATDPPTIPQSWKDAWLYFLPKPGKSCTHPNQLRPISLMEPLGKLILGIIAKQLRAQVNGRLSQSPHFGFLPRRSALDAVTRVAAHCKKVRKLVGTQRRSIFQQMDNIPKMIFCGGIQLYLDMTRAFDSVCRNTLFEHMTDLRLPPSLLSIITHWHQDTNYNLLFQGKTTSIPVGKGLRQGCMIAPTLWVLYMDKFIALLEQKIDPRWITQCLTIYADDLHAGCEFHTRAEFQQALINFGIILDTLEALQLQLSYSKSFIILAYGGTHCRPGLKGHLERDTSGSCILIPRATGQKTSIPLRSKGKYLGTELSYTALEAHTWQHRKKAAWTAFRRLTGWFRSRQLHARQRLHLWKTCVLTVLQYGLFSTSLTVKEIEDAQTTIYRMVRTVLHDHAFRTGLTHQQVFSNHGIPLPLEMLAANAMVFWTRLQRRAQQLDSHDFLHKVDWSHVPELIKLINCVHARHLEVPLTARCEPGVTQARHACPHCSFVTHTVANLRRHMTIAHHDSQFRTCTISPLDMTYQGKPQCNNCFLAFTTWRRFFIHVERDCCRATQRPMATASDALTQSMSNPMPRPHTEPTDRPNVDNFVITQQSFWASLALLIKSQAWIRLLQLRDVGQFLAHKCLICGMWFSRCQELHSHFRTHHNEMMPGTLAKGAQLVKLLDLTSPCCLCGKTFRNGHSCPVMTQLAALSLHVIDDRPLDLASRTCDICHTVHDAMNDLHRHLYDAHGLQVHDWCPSRDCLPHSDACAHCGHVYEGRASLRRHILDGRCPEFDPSASAVPNDVKGTWSQILQDGHLCKPFLTAQQRQRLTLSCQLCGATYSRQNDLGQHLQQSHGEVWTSSQPFFRFLLQVILAVEGCQCNPCAHTQGRTHICCSLRQLAMIAMVCSWDLLVPAQFDRPHLAERFATLTAHGAIQHITDALVQRDFQVLWTNPFCLVFLRFWCVICGGHHHPAALTQHQLRQHPDECAWSA